MKPEAFVQEMEAFEEGIAESPEMMKALIQLLEVVEEQQACIQTLLAVNKRLLANK